ncbi:tyrosine-type recombinase/integrase [Pediococcus acidilactici]|uniref:tyrosine-type recombinase/integrase n=1 Tax=Pediococcus acidilactici TaxID=1254 RepID=UPI003B42DFDB
MASIKKQNGKWTARITWRDEEGKRHYKSKYNFKTQSEAELWAADFQLNKRDIDSETYFPAYFYDWYLTYKEPSVTNRTKATYLQLYNVLKKSLLAKKPVGEITRKDYQRFINVFGKKHAKSTVTKFNSLIHACVKDALYDKAIEKDFVYGVSMVFNKSKTRKIDYLNIDEMNTLSTYLRSSLNKHFTSKYMILTAIYTGARLGEIQALTWKDINTTFNSISIRRSWNDEAQKFQPTKNESSVRIIKINDDLAQLLKQLKPKSSNTKIFTNQYGTVPSSSAVNKTLRESLAHCGIDKPSFHFHSLRHTHVAYLLSENVDLFIISKRLGHSDISTTSRVYSYLIDEYKQKADLRIEKSLDKISLNSKNVRKIL